MKDYGGSRMRKNKGYLLAAKMTSNQQEFYSCDALNETCGWNSKSHRNYESFFRPNDIEMNQFDCYGFNWYGQNDILESNLARSIALLFMYEMGEE